MTHSIDYADQLKKELLAVTLNNPSILSADRLAYWRDNGILSQVAEKFIQNKIKYPLLSAVRINFIWRNHPEIIGDMFQKKVSVKKYGYREIDIFGYDIQIEVCARIWLRTKPKERDRLIEHALKHIEVLIKEDGSPDYDSMGRIKTRIQLPDIRISAFKSELEDYGLSKDELYAAGILTNQYNSFKEEEAKREKVQGREQ